MRTRAMTARLEIRFEQSERGKTIAVRYPASSAIKHFGSRFIRTKAQ
jgi:hypothetical protein